MRPEINCIRLLFSLLFALVPVALFAQPSGTTAPLPKEAPPAPFRIVIGDCLNLSPKATAKTEPRAITAIVQELNRTGKERFALVPPQDVLAAAKRLGLLTPEAAEAKPFSHAQWLQIARELKAEGLLEAQIAISPPIPDRIVEVSLSLKLFDSATDECINGGYHPAKAKTYEEAWEEATQNAVRQFVQRSVSAANVQKREGSVLLLDQGLRNNIKAGDSLVLIRIINGQRTKIGTALVKRAYAVDSEAEIKQAFVKIRSGDQAIVRYGFYRKPLPVERQRAEAGASIYEITLEHTACLGQCSVFRVVFRRDGTVLYWGKEHTRRIGKYTGKLDIFLFDRLAEFAVESGYFRLKDEYFVPVNDLPSTITSVVQDGKRKTIRDYGDAGPSSLWAFEELLRSAFAQVENWTKILKKEEADFLLRFGEYE